MDSFNAYRLLETASWRLSPNPYPILTRKSHFSSRYVFNVQVWKSQVSFSTEWWFVNTWINYPDLPAGSHRDIFYCMTSGTFGFSACFLLYLDKAWYRSPQGGFLRFWIVMSCIRSSLLFKISSWLQLTKRQFTPAFKRSGTIRLRLDSVYLTVPLFQSSMCLFRFASRESQISLGGTWFINSWFFSNQSSNFPCLHFFNQTFCIIRTHNITESKYPYWQCKILIFENDSGNFAVEITDTTFNVSHWFVLRVGFLNDPHRGGSSGQNSIVLFGDLTI